MAKFSWLTVNLANKAIKRIGIQGVPPNRKSTRFDVVHKAKLFPPKLVISEAARLADIYFDHRDFGGGLEANGALLRLGFRIFDREAKEYLGDTDPNPVWWTSS